MRATQITLQSWIRLAPFIVCLVGCGNHSDSYFPLEADRYWQYTIERSTMDGTQIQKYLIESLPTVTWNGSTVSRKRTVDGSEYFYIDGVNGIERVAKQLRTDNTMVAEDPTRLVLPAKVTVGTTWQQASTTLLLETSGPPWESLYRVSAPLTLTYEIEDTDETITVAAGRFEKCLKITALGSTTINIGNYIGTLSVTVGIEEWYAPGIGLVMAHRREQTNAEALKFGQMTMELETYR